MKTMIDSGSSVSIITTKALNKLTFTEVYSCNITLLDYSSNPIPTHGAVSLILFPDSHHPVQHDFLVVSSKYMKEDLLLGMDALSKGSVFIDYAQKKFKWNDFILAIEYGTTTNMRNLKVCVNPRRLARDVYVPCNITLFPGKVTELKVKAIPESLYEVKATRVKGFNQHLLLAKSFLLETQTDPWLMIPLFNPGQGKIKIKKGTKLGVMELISEPDITYRDSDGNELGDHHEVIRLLKDDGNVEERTMTLCPTHKHVFCHDIPSFITLVTGEIWQCFLCCNKRVQVNLVKENKIDNAMIPQIEESNEEGLSRREKLVRLINQLDLSNINSKSKVKLENLITKHENLFILDKTEMGLIKVPDNHIELVDNTPIRMPLYRHPEKAKDIIQAMIQEMIDKDIIEPSYAAYLSPIVLINKPDGSKRMCIDYRAVNTKIKIDIHPLPRLDELIDDVSGHNYYCTLDLKDAYYQCLLDHESRDVTTFSDGKNLYRFKRLPFGLSVAPAIFTRVMQEVLRPLLKLGFIKNYLDDVIIYGPDIETLLYRLDLVFTRMAEKGLKLNVAKCNFCKRKIKFLGHYVSRNGIEVNPKSIEGIVKMNPPRTTKEVRRFIGMASFYRKFIPQFAKIAAPLTSLQSKKVQFTWNAECQQAFEELKNKLVQTPVLVKVDLNKPLELHTDASNFHVGAVLMQREEDGLHPVGYFSKKLNKCEQKYSVTDKEALSIVKATRFFHHFLWGIKFSIVTDHQPLTAIFKRKTHSPRMSRYMLEMREYNFEIQYKQGKHNLVPDMLSRPCGKRAKVHNIRTVPVLDSTNFPGLTPEKIKVEQRKDKIWAKVIKYCEGGSIPNRTPGNRTLSCFELIDGLLYVRREEFKRLTYCLVIPRSLKAVACSIAHDHTHLGQHKSVKRSQQYFYWPSQWKDIVQYVRSCKVCQQFKAEGALVYKWQELPPVEDKGKRIAVDLIDMHAGKGGFRYCLTVIDHFSRFLRVYPLRNKTTSLVLKALQKDLCVFGVPEVALMDNGSEFTSREFKGYCQKLGINQVLCLPYHPRGNSVLERAHRTLKSVLAMLSRDHPNNWPDRIPEAVKILNESVHTSLSTSPFFIQFGYHPSRKVGTLTLPEQEELEGQSRVDLKKQIKETLGKQTRKYRDHANATRRNDSLQENEMVWIYQENPLPGTAVKLNRKWIGPYKIVSVIDSGRAYEVQDMFDGSRVKRAAEKLKRYIEREEILNYVREDFLSPEEERVLLPDVRRRKPPVRYTPY